MPKYPENTIVLLHFSAHRLVQILQELVDKSGGLVPAIAQDAATGEVLMMAYMNKEAFEETVRTKRAVYFSRSRNKLWRKGEEPCKGSSRA